jgi:hypothetical protein
LPLYKRTSGATATNAFERLKKIFTKRSESTENAAVRRRIAGVTLPKFASVAALLSVTVIITAAVVVTASMIEIVTMIVTAAPEPDVEGF